MKENKFIDFRGQVQTEINFEDEDVIIADKQKHVKYPWHIIVTIFDKDDNRKSVNTATVDIYNASKKYKDYRLLSLVNYDDVQYTSVIVKEREVKGDKNV